MKSKPLIWFERPYWCCGQREGWHVQRHTIMSAYVVYVFRRDWLKKTR